GQTPGGSFRTSGELARDGGIDEALKDVLEALDEHIRARLIHSYIRGIEAVVSRVEQPEQLITTAKDLLKKNTSVSQETDKFRTACLTLFQWLARNDRWNDLNDALPVYTLDRTGADRLART